MLYGNLSRLRSSCARTSPCTVLHPKLYIRPHVVDACRLMGTQCTAFMSTETPEPVQLRALSVTRQQRYKPRAAPWILGCGRQSSSHPHTFLLFTVVSLSTCKDERCKPCSHTKRVCSKLLLWMQHTVLSLSPIFNDFAC